MSDALGPTDPVGLTRQLVRLDTAGANEAAAVALLADRVRRVGAETRVVDLAPGRAGLVAHVPPGRAGAGDGPRDGPGDGPGDGSVITLSGHLDTVPAEPADWSSDPWAAEIRDGQVYGRGSSDMKSGVAAIICALQRHLAADHDCRGVQLLLTAAEETGCRGAASLAAVPGLHRGGPLFVAEPTGNRIALGHKGALWLRLDARGRAAHGSRPDLGVNAVTRLARAAVALEDGAGRPAGRDGTPVTVNVGTLRGGVQTNLVPDSATMTVDVRTVAGVTSDDVLSWARAAIAEHVEVTADLDLAPVGTDAADPLVASLADLLERRFGFTPAHRPAATYFTDASVLAPALNGSPTVILGPGEPEFAHTVDERCDVAAIDTAANIYTELLDVWCRRHPSADG